ncbi:phosphatidylinositol-specific phospholipase C/glycerophosphodiester phosphodiesterase family protein [Nocardioides sp. SR21]|uniref:phosphatidylinositol-specific phospholipase C/glycerophosphodiester phosphodiesterase family protein n=1 Tax=Nocardioides sp. SR21 TaxID=2919501 RepID=UPI001FAAC04A|nr:phosphatidylinositol-specific phospholipase C/glycerophosphodiester phosphodiesterase family protein [Nocardioides sp. SR21]
MRLPLRLAALTTSALLGVLLGVPLGPGIAPATALAPAPAVAPLAQAHAHNDYEHARPLLDALANGFTSVEADVWLVDGKLLVAHDLADVDPKRTLSSLYLDPLTKRVRANKGSVYPHWRGRFQLLIDVKSEATATYRAIHAELRAHRRIITAFVGDDVRRRAVRAVISGGRDRDLMASQRVRYAGYDGGIDEIDAGTPATLMPLVSESWWPRFAWRGVGPMPEDERAELLDIVERAHAGGYRVRFWDTPDIQSPGRRAVWTELVETGVDYLNTDDLYGLKQFLRRR